MVIFLNSASAHNATVAYDTTYTTSTVNQSINQSIDRSQNAI